MTSPRTILAVAAVAGALAVAAPVASAAAAPAGVAEDPCGYFERPPYALYNNCGTTNQLITIDLTDAPDKTQCVGLGRTSLESGAARTVSAGPTGTC